MLLDDSGSMLFSDYAKAGELQRQFSSVFSDPLSECVKEPTFSSPHINFSMDLDYLQPSEDDFYSAISELNTNAGAGPDGIPAVLIKKCAAALVAPLKYIWSESLNLGVVPLYFKVSHIHPLFKKGERAEASNYRPISMTSHIIKIFERILRKKIVFSLEQNKILTPYQHGFM